MERLTHKWIEKSLALASGTEERFSGAVLVCGGEEICSSREKMLKTDDPTAHALVVVVREARIKHHSFLLCDCEVYVSTKPCPMCMLAVFQAGIKHVFYPENNEIQHLVLTPQAMMGAKTKWIF